MGVRLQAKKRHLLPPLLQPSTGMLYHPIAHPWPLSPTPPTTRPPRNWRILNLSFHLAAKDIPSMVKDVEYLLLLAKVYKSHRREDVLETLNKVMDRWPPAGHVLVPVGNLGKSGRSQTCSGLPFIPQNPPF